MKMPSNSKNLLLGGVLLCGINFVLHKVLSEYPEKG